jgi:hypothetical protein
VKELGITYMLLSYLPLFYFLNIRPPPPPPPPPKKKKRKEKRRSKPKRKEKGVSTFHTIDVHDYVNFVFKTLDGLGNSMLYLLIWGEH